MDNPKVSVIVPVYNVEKYLQKCIDSLLAQTYTNIELIFVDDGSRDGSISVLRKAAEQDLRIRVFSQENAGPSAARNRGMDYSTGKYIMFCDSDDTVDPRWCETMVNAIELHPDSWVVCEIQILSGKEIVNEFTHSAGTEILGKDAYYQIYAEGLSGSVNNKIYSTRMVRENGIRFDETKLRGEDVSFALQYFSVAKGIFVCAEKLYNYHRYIDVETLTNRFHPDDFDAHRELFRIRHPYIAERDLRSFYRQYWLTLYRETEYVMDRNTQNTLWEKICINSRNIQTAEFQFLLNVVGKEENAAIVFWCLKSGNYFLYWLLRKVSKAKNKLLRKLDDDANESN